MSSKCKCLHAHADVFRKCKHLIGPLNIFCCSLTFDIDTSRRLVRKRNLAIKLQHTVMNVWLNVLSSKWGSSSQNITSQVQAASPIMERLLCQKTSRNSGLLSVCALWVWTEGWGEGSDFTHYQAQSLHILGGHAYGCMLIWRKTAHGLCRLNHPAKFSHAATVSCSALSGCGLAYLSRL